MKGIKFIGICVFVFLAFLGLNTVLTKVDSYVVRKGYVENVENNVITIVDTTGTMWNWKQEEQMFDKWDKVKMIMDNNNTIDTEKDDIILKIRLDK